MKRIALEVSGQEFRMAMKPFVSRRRPIGPALLAYESGFLSIESGDIVTVMHASGHWPGQARFSKEILQALAAVPPTQNPVPITYADGHLMIGTMTVPCQWTDTVKQVAQSVVEPTLIDLLALAKTMSRSEYLGTELGKRVRSAQEKAERRIRNATTQLADLQITESEIRRLIERRIKERIAPLADVPRPDPTS